ncbi:MAG: aminodeoxychorismate synthase component I, partial [Flavobacterium sp.]|nr:aminodeoxychorismate synthase component I [Flavobacterium sp.]
MRVSVSKPISDPKLFKKQLLTWSQQFRELVYLDSNEYDHRYSSYDCVLAVDAFTSLKTDFYNAFDDLAQYQQTTKDWLFGYLSYDLKNDLEPLTSANFDGLHFPDLFFFQPKKLFLINGDAVEIQYLGMCDDELEADFEEIVSQILHEDIQEKTFEIKQRITPIKYIEKVGNLLERIQRGDIYEANF